MDMVVQGRQILNRELELIRALLADNPDWGRTRLSEELCQVWRWRTASGRPKEMACRTLLLKLERRGLIDLPPARRPANNALRNRTRVEVSHDTDPIGADLRDLVPLKVTVVESGSSDLALFSCLLEKYHYLGHRICVGQNQKYLIRDRQDRPLCCLLFGSSAWSTKPRDEFIGWGEEQRRARLQWVTNNSRFLILPWVRVANLASHSLGLVGRRIRRDWIEKYGHPVSLLETFVDRSRFAGTCYQAANWLHVGSSTGRTRNDRRGKMNVPVKAIYVLPLLRHFRRELCPSRRQLDVDEAGR